VEPMHEVSLNGWTKELYLMDEEKEVRHLFLGLEKVLGRKNLTLA